MGNIVIDVAKTESGYCAACDILPGWVVAVTGDFATLDKEVRESIDFFRECALADGVEYPKVLDEDFVIDYKFDIRSLLCFYQSIFSFAALQYITGINQRQLWHYAAGYSKPRKAQADKIVDGLHKLGKELLQVSV